MRSRLLLALAVLVGLAAAPAGAVADEEPPDPGKPFDQKVTPPPDPRLAANRGLWLELAGGLFAPLGGGRVPGGGGALSVGWGFGNGLVTEGQFGFWYHTRPIGEDADDATHVVPILLGARYRAVTLWRYKPVLYGAAHLGPVITKAFYPDSTATGVGFGLQAVVGVQIPFARQWFVDASFGYLLDAGGTPDAGTIMHRFGTGHALLLMVGITYQQPKADPYDPLGLRKLGPSL